MAARDIAIFCRVELFWCWRRATVSSSHVGLDPHITQLLSLILDDDRGRKSTSFVHFCNDRGVRLYLYLPPMGDNHSPPAYALF